MARGGPHEQMAIADRRKKVAELYLRGYTQHDIAAHPSVRVSPQTIYLDLKALREQWVKDMSMAIGQRQAEELAKIDRLEKIANDAFDRSCEAAEMSTRTYKRVRSVTKDARGRVQVRMVPVADEEVQQKKGQCGDPRFLERIAWCVETRLRIFGILQKNDKAGALNVVQINWGGLTRPAAVVQSAPNGEQLLEQQPVQQIVDQSDPIEVRIAQEASVEDSVAE